MARAPPPPSAVLPSLVTGLGGGWFPPEVLVLLSDAPAPRHRLAMASRFHAV